MKVTPWLRTVMCASLLNVEIGVREGFYKSFEAWVWGKHTQSWVFLFFCIELFELLLLYLEMIFLIKWLSGFFSWFNGSLRDLCIWVRLMVARSPLSPPTDYQSIVTYCQPTSSIRPLVWMVNWLNICKPDSVESGNGLSLNQTRSTDRPMDTLSLS